MKKYILIPFLITIIKAWSLDSLWEYTLKNKPKSTNYYFLMDPDNLLSSESKDNLEKILVHLYSQWSIYGYFFLIKN